MLVYLRDDNRTLTRHLRMTHELCDGYHDGATASPIEELDRPDRAPDLVPV